MKFLKVLLVIVAAIAVVGGAYLYNTFYGANDFFDVEKKGFYVNKGQTWEQVVDSLEAKEIIRSRRLFEFVVRISNKGKQTHVGKYEFKSGVTNKELYDNLRLGRGILPINVTLKEGRRAISFARAFHRTLKADTVRFMNLVNDATFARSLGVEANTLEGYLAPNTYQFNWQADEEDILRRLVKQTEKLFNDSLRARATELNLTVHQVLSLAAIVEGEALLDDERPIIAGVYHNRLRKGMKLEADPTIQFIMPDGPRRVLYSDLQIVSPYNTYLNYGLPPGPISNPSTASILATLYPTKHEYLFFVANLKGGHWFSRDYAGHMNNVKKFRRERAAQIRGQGVS